MSEDLLALLEQNKELLTKKVYQRVKKNIDKIPEEAKEEITVQLQNAAHLKKLIDEYDDQRMEVLVNAFRKFKEVEENYELQYNEAMQKLEEEEKKMAMEGIEASLKNIK